MFVVICFCFLISALYFRFWICFCALLFWVYFSAFGCCLWLMSLWKHVLTGGFVLYWCGCCVGFGLLSDFRFGLPS